MKLARLSGMTMRERTGGVPPASPVPLGGQSAVQFPYNLISYFPNPAKPRGVRSHSGPAAMLNKYSLTSQRPLVQHLPVETWAKAGASTASPSPLFIQVNDNRTHSQPPVLVLEKPNMEESVSGVCPKDLPKVTEADIDQARLAHQRLVVRLMVSPGDSEGAMRRAEQMFGLSYWCQVNLRQKRRASPEFLARLHAAWFSMLEASVVRDTAELLEHRKGDEAA